MKHWSVYGFGRRRSPTVSKFVADIEAKTQAIRRVAVDVAAKAAVDHAVPRRGERHPAPSRVMPVSYLDNPERWRRRAEEARTLAHNAKHSDSKRKMFEVAEGYEKLARRAEQRRVM